MSPLLSDYAGSRDNNFNLIRFIAAMLVLYSHSFALATGVADAEPMRAALGITWGSVAVDVFFVSSGFLIAASYFSRSNFWAFTWARMLRILPGLWVAVGFCVFVVGMAFTTLSTTEYLSHSLTWRYVLENSVLLFGIEYRLPGVFKDLPWEDAVNGSLWTLPNEVKMYIILALTLLALGKLSKGRPVLVKYCLFAIAVLSVLTNIANHHYGFTKASFVHLFSMFFVGASFYAWRESVRMSSGLASLMLLAVLVSASHREIFFVVYLLCLPYLTLFAAYVPGGRIRNFNRYGDYSYGIYIYAFPVQQSVAAMVAGISVAGMTALSTPITLILAYLSWHLVEKRCLKLKSLPQVMGLLRARARPGT